MAVGEVVLSSTLCNSLKKTFPKAQVDFLVHDISAGLFINHPHIDNVISLTSNEIGNPIKFWRKLRQIVARGYDLVVDAQGSHRSELISLFARKRAICIGYAPRGRGFSLSDKFYTNVVAPNRVVAKQTADASRVSEILRLLEPLVAMGFDVKRDDLFSVNTPMALKNEMRTNMEASGVDFKRAVFLMSVTNPRWGVTNMQSWAHYAMEAYNAQIVLCSESHDQQAELESFYQAMGGHPDVHASIPANSLDKLAAMMSHCDLFLGNEGPARCIAQACKLPSVSIYSPKADKAQLCGPQHTLHQGVQWQDVSDLSRNDVLRISEELRSERRKPNIERHQALYSSIKLDHAIELLDSVAEAAGVRLRRDIAV